MGARKLLSRPVLLASALVALPSACGLDWSMAPLEQPTEDGSNTGSGGAASGASTTTSSANASSSAEGAGGSTVAAGGVGGWGGEGGAGTAQSSSTAATGGGPPATCDSVATSCEECATCAEATCFTECLNDAQCETLDWCINEFCGGDDFCIGVNCGAYPDWAWDLYDAAIYCQDCLECPSHCGC